MATPSQALPPALNVTRKTLSMPPTLRWSITFTSLSLLATTPAQSSVEFNFNSAHPARNQVVEQGANHSNDAADNPINNGT